MTDDDDMLLNWKQFEGLLGRKFKPVNITKVTRDTLACLYQTSSVKAYNITFISTILEISTIGEEELVNRYVRGLKENICVKVELCESTHLEEAMCIADH